MGRVLILEGPDGSGKTTLARYLEENYDFEYVHLGPPTAGEDLLLTYAKILNDAIRSPDDHVIDRLHIGESVYGPIVRKVDRIGETGQTILERIIRGAGVLEVQCMPPRQVAYGNWFRRRAAVEMVTDSNTYETIYEKYRSIFSHDRYVKAFRYNYLQHNHLDDAVRMLSRAHEQLNRLPYEETCAIGSPEAKYLFVGEIANQKELDIPWLALNNSSDFLNTCLWEAGFKENEMAFVNALRLNGTYNELIRVFTKLPRAKIIALGGVARKQCQLLYNFHLDHPAYWKRFHSSERSTYVNKLREIRNKNGNLDSGTNSLPSVG